MKNRTQHQHDLSGLHIMPYISWTVESGGIFIINSRSGASQYLAYPQAALWNLLVQGYTYLQILKMLSAIASLDDDKTEVLIQETLYEWVENCFLKQDLDHG